MPFLNPLGLLLLGLAAPMVAMYFLKLRRKRVEVPSIMLWQEVVEAERLATPFDRFRRNLLLLLQLLALLLIGLALARPFLKGVATRQRAIVMVVDVSASMAAEDVEPTRLGEAVDRALAVIDDMGAADEASVILAGSRTTVAVPFTRDRDRLRRGVRDATVQLAEGDLTDALALAVSLGSSRPHREVIVFSDGAAGDLRDIELAAEEVEFVPIGRGGENVGITAVDLRPDPTSTADFQLFLKVENFGRETVNTSLVIDMDRERLGLRELELAPGVAEGVLFEGLPSVPGTIRARLRPGDMFPVDDEAYALLRPADRIRVLVVGGNALLLRALLADPMLEVEVVQAESYRGSAGYDCTIFDGWFPEEGVAGHPYLALGLPPAPEGATSASASVLPVLLGAPRERPEVLSWTRSHPSLRFVELTDVLVGEARAVVDQGGLVPVVESTTGPLVLAGVDRGGRALVTTFDVLATDLPIRVAFPLFMLNSVRWLAGAEQGEGGGLHIASGGVFTAQIPQEAGRTREVRVLSPEGEERNGRITDGLLRVADTAEIGVYRVDTPGGPLHFAANLTSERESDLWPRAELRLADTVEAGAVTARSRQEIWRPLALLACLLLIPEWWFWLRREATA